MKETIQVKIQLIRDILDWANARDGSAQTDELNLQTIARIAAHILEEENLRQWSDEQLIARGSGSGGGGGGGGH